MNKENGASGDVHGRGRRLERTHTVKLGNRSGLTKAPLLRPAIKNGRLPRHAPKALALSARPRLRAVDLQLRTSVSPYILDKENREAVYSVLTQSQKPRTAHKAKSI
jgi:hypothetical protein